MVWVKRRGRGRRGRGEGNEYLCSVVYLSCAATTPCAASCALRHPVRPAHCVFPCVLRSASSLGGGLQKGMGHLSLISVFFSLSFTLSTPPRYFYHHKSHSTITSTPSKSCFFFLEHHVENTYRRREERG